MTVDALNCQRAIAQQIIDQGGDYAFALKGNQGTLHTDVAVFLDDPLTKATTEHTTVDADHGRIETRGISVSTDIDWLQERHRWPGLEAIGKVTRTRETGDKISTETAYYLFSTPITAERGGEVVRSHWGVEKRLHWRLDVTMNEDAARNRMDNGPHNLAVLRHMALNVMGREESKTSLRAKFKKPRGIMIISCDYPAVHPYPLYVANVRQLIILPDGEKSGEPALSVWRPSPTDKFGPAFSKLRCLGWTVSWDAFGRRSCVQG